MNGPTGILIGAGKGVIRSMLCKGELKSEVIPVDIAVNGLILLPYNQSLMETKYCDDAAKLHFVLRLNSVLRFLTSRSRNVPVYNLTIADEKKRTWKWIMDVGRDFGQIYPFDIGLWYPDGNMTENKLYHWFCVVMFMWLPAYLVDFIFLLVGQRRL